MVILSQPRLLRRYADGEDFVTAPVSWLDRHRMYLLGGRRHSPAPVQFLVVYNGAVSRENRLEAGRGDGTCAPKPGACR